ncbi:circularly permuted type 2 ATP-grasp protein [Aliiglaciecola sp. 3_MG-2023]|uniref:circularly permuted type 2 ATP-grasp protein n=1 Tax=Aliiglaciecola sp. 3_MG-2023 TaxID=3062644 RepID=UPI0026E4018E|nr:circularly permuted type 2 ATP-grasp protein [Aliiglaciecola sp. 3_MG-2023]MDO6693343.1 circularly permuted type 2 ATP-grasp protein [Aliiglaciecola sp. 3_MG-2023]
MAIRWGNYAIGQFYDELIQGRSKPRKHAKDLCDYLKGLSDNEIKEYKAASDSAIQVMGITFRVYNDEEGSIDRAWPFDIVPRLIELKEWQQIELGLKQRVKALNMFIDDLYNDQNIIKDGVFPADLLKKSKNFLKDCIGVKPPQGIWAHICGSDLVRDHNGTFYVLEDNLRVPSGVSYMLENRQVMKRVFPEMFEKYNILPIDNYPSDLYDMLASLSPRDVKEPEIVVLTPGIYNSAYFEHAYLAQQMGAELVTGDDLVVKDDDCVYMRTINGLSRVDVIYRRIDDWYIDPEVFHPDSQLGVPGIMRAWKKGNVGLANAPGSGVADDKVVYSYVPDIIKYYLNEEALLPNVPTYRCINPDEREYVLENIEQMVVKPANESGGYGMLIGPHASKREHQKFRQLIKKDPRNYVAQPMLLLSTAPTLIDNKAEGRHLDLRPFILSGQDIKVTMGGLTRVAMTKGSTVVNSSQGGGSKDTWIVDMEGD